MELLLIHGSHHGKWFYENFDNELDNKNIKYTHFELLGHGEKRDDKVYTIDKYADDLFSFLENKENIIIIAHSLGCFVTHYCINKYNICNNKIKKIFFLAPSIFVNIFKTIYSGIFSYKYLYNLFFNGVFGKSIEEIKNAFFMTETDIKIVEKCYNKLEKMNHTNLRNFFTYLNKLKPINNITIDILVGNKDIITPYYCLEDLLNIYYIKENSKFVCFNNIGHNLLLDNNWKKISNYIIKNLEII